MGCDKSTWSHAAQVAHNVVTWNTQQQEVWHLLPHWGSRPTCEIYVRFVSVQVQQRAESWPIETCMSFVSSCTRWVLRVTAAVSRSISWISRFLWWGKKSRTWGTFTRGGLGAPYAPGAVCLFGYGVEE